VIANFERWKADPNSNSLDSLGVADYRRVDERTVEVELGEARAQALWIIGYSWGILAPEAVTMHANALSGDPTKLIGTGPFKVESYTRGQGLVLTGNPDYTSAPGDSANQGPAYLERVEVNFVSDPAVRVGLLTSNQAGVIANVPAMFLPQIEASPDYQIHRMEAPGIPFQISLNTQKPPLDDILVRQGLRASFDIKAALDAIYFGQYPQAWSILSASTPAYDPALEGSFSFDADGAGRLLDEAGWAERDSDGIRIKDGKRLELTWAVRAATVEDQRDILAEALQAMARSAGISILRTPMDSGAYTNVMREGSYHLTDRAASTPDPYILRRLYGSDMLPTAGLNYSRVADPELDAILAPLMNSSDDALRTANARQVQALVNQNVWAIPVYPRTLHFGSRAEVQGLGFDVSGWLDSWQNVWISR
ncbi:MAG TPA: ABC transporter substrate-binding protein, partial [Devosia sp.]|nr:ABC transporter substrate-binding protein [Devosia sp.]